MKILITLLLLSALCFVVTGCVNVKEAQIDNATFNTAGWKSQAGVSGGANIEATTIPTADISATGL
jgi:hypothetical protein